jgi:hypothetical protein
MIVFGMTMFVSDPYLYSGMTKKNHISRGTSVSATYTYITHGYSNTITNTVLF